MPSQNCHTLSKNEKLEIPKQTFNESLCYKLGWAMDWWSESNGWNNSNEVKPQIQI